MGRQIIRQPNGLLATYSTVVDQLTAWNATAGDLAHAAADEAYNKVYDDTLAAARRAAETGSSSTTQFRMTWDEAYAEHLAHGGEAINVRQPDSDGA